jgi:hypothetical protein
MPLTSLPNGERAVVEQNKIIHYLLSESHPSGRAKAAFFRRFGYRKENWRLLRDGLLAHGCPGEIVEQIMTEFGMKYVIEGPLRTPDGRNPILRSVWIIEANESAPRFVTAYPGR